MSPPPPCFEVSPCLNGTHQRGPLQCEEQSVPMSDRVSALPHPHWALSELRSAHPTPRWGVTQASGRASLLSGVMLFCAFHSIAVLLVSVHRGHGLHQMLLPLACLLVSCLPFAVVFQKLGLPWGPWLPEESQTIGRICFVRGILFKGPPMVQKKDICRVESSAWLPIKVSLIIHSMIGGSAIRCLRHPQHWWRNLIARCNCIGREPVRLLFFPSRQYFFQL